MAIAPVQIPTVVVATSVTSTTKAFASNVTAGNCIVTVESHYDSGGATINTPTDTLTHTYLAAINAHTTPGGPPNDQTIRAYYVLNISGGANTVTFNSGSGSCDITGGCAEFSGVATSGALGVVGTADSTGTAVSVSTSGTPDSGSMVVAIMTFNGSDTTITAGQTIIVENEANSTTAGMGSEYELSSGGTSTWTLGASRVWSADNFEMKAAATTAVKDIIGGGLIPFAR